MSHFNDSAASWHGRSLLSLADALREPGEPSRLARAIAEVRAEREARHRLAHAGTDANAAPQGVDVACPEPNANHPADKPAPRPAPGAPPEWSPDPLSSNDPYPQISALVSQLDGLRSLIDAEIR